jgi:hypothetical protein
MALKILKALEIMWPAMTEYGSLDPINKTSSTEDNRDELWIC